MKGWAKSTLVLLLILLLTTTFFALLSRPREGEAIPEAPHVAIELRISRQGLAPEEIRVAQGSVVHLNVTADAEDHHFGLPAFGVSRWISAGETTEIRFTATLQGTFTYRCLITAPGHLTERGDLIVLPPP